MKMKDNFVVFILTHKRPTKQLTLETLRKQGYTGRIYLVVDDDKVERVYELANDVVGGFDNPNTGIFVSLPVDFVRGVHKK